MNGQWFPVPEICRIIDLLVNENKLTVPFNITEAKSEAMIEPDNYPDTWGSFDVC